MYTADCNNKINTRLHMVVLGLFVDMFILCLFQIYELAKETVVLLLDFNPDTQGLLEWVIDRCYTGANEVADGCFNALAAVFQSRYDIVLRD